MSQTELKDLLGPDVEVLPYGSTAIFGDGEDLDYLVWAPDTLKVLSTLHSHGYIPDCAPGYDASDFTSVRKGSVNVIVCSSKEWYNKSAYACAVCKCMASAGWLSPSNKRHRVAIHEAIKGEL